MPAELAVEGRLLGRGERVETITSLFQRSLLHKLIREDPLDRDGLADQSHL
jgi:hypothetical protein